MTEPISDYGSGHSGEVIVDRTGPFPPPDDALTIAALVATGKASRVNLPHPCMDCVPNIVLKDERCAHCGDWEWGMLVAHDDTCPTNNGLSAPPRTTD